jgi:hypothetical protein
MLSRRTKRLSYGSTHQPDTHGTATEARQPTAPGFDNRQPLYDSMLCRQRFGLNCGEQEADRCLGEQQHVYDMDAPLK